MRIGIQISSDFKKRTGLEEYIYQLLRHLPGVDGYKNHQFFLFSRENLKWPLKWGWTQLRLSKELKKRKLDILFIPGHTFPLVHPKLVISIQGLEFEKVPRMYSWWQKKRLRFLTKRNAEKADKIIVPSKTTKNDLVELYKTDPDKIFVVPHGVSHYTGNSQIVKEKYILYIGSNHKRKNIIGLIKAFKVLRKKYKVPHKLILVGVDKGEYTGSRIKALGYVNNQEKRRLLNNADVFVWPSFYEGFGFPVLEAQSAGIPVIASNTGSLPEILNDSALLINPRKHKEIAKAVYKVISDLELKNSLIKKGLENVKRFSWDKCAQQTLKVITS